MMTEVVASSSSSPYGWPYHVFLSFRGVDTRLNFTGHLYNALDKRGIRTFIDDEGIRKGEEITYTLSKAIEESKTAIVVFSENYASSTFCLTELVHIFKCMKGVEGRSIWCVFYHVDPSDVRHQKNSYEDAFNKHERVYKKSVDNWRLALEEAANFSGFHLDRRSRKYEHEVIEDIIDTVSKEINDGPLFVARYPVALESQVKEVRSILNQQIHRDGAIIVGIHGTGGIGKTTLARALYNEFERHFKQYSCFLSNIGEKSIHDLLKMVLSKTIKEKDIGLEYDISAISIIKERLQRKKVLLILDNVDKLEQLEMLVGEPNWFGAGSIIIITTRNKGLLTKHDIKIIHEVKQLGDCHAHELLTLNAFKEKQVDPNYKTVIERVVKYACGLPLALEIIGSNLRGLTIKEWESALGTYETNPPQNIQKVLEVSYHGLEEDKHREIFLDIACFYKGYKLGYAMHMLQSSHGTSPDYCLRELIDKSLIKIDANGCLGMHDLIEDMGQEIVRKESTLEPGKRSRLWSYQDILHVLKENTGTKNIQGIKLDLHPPEEVDWSGEAFEKMKNLRVLIIKGAIFFRGPKCLPNSLRVLEWPNYPSSLPYDFHPINVVILNLSHSRLTLEKPFERMKNLSVLNLKSCQSIIQVPDVSGIPNLRELVLDYCDKLTEIHDSVGNLSELETLSVKRCAKLCTFPHAIKLPSLKNLKLEGCSSLKNFPEILEKIEGIIRLDLTETNLELPFSIQNLSKLQYLRVTKSQSIQQPSSIVMLPELIDIMIDDCGEVLAFKQDEGQEESSYMVSSNVLNLCVTNCNKLDEFLRYCLPFFASVLRLDLSNSNITFLPACIKECCSLISLSLNDCKHLREIAAIPSSTTQLEAINCNSLSSESRSILLSQELHERRGRRFCMPAETIPDWFEHRRSGASISFWFYYESPMMSMCHIMPDDNRPTSDYLQVNTIINGQSLKFSSRLNYCIRGCLNSPRLIEIRDHMFTVDFVFPQRCPMHKWYHVEIRANFGKEIGIHALPLGNNVRFADPYDRKGKLDDFLIDTLGWDEYSSSRPQWTTYTGHKEQEAIFIEECEELLSFKEVWSKLTSLCLINCNVLDEFLPICLPFLANMQSLDLSGSNITILPARIKECGSLKFLTLNDCKHLEKIVAIPPSIEELWAINCYSLSSESRSILLNQELHESGPTHFCVPTERIPEWLDHSRRGPSPSFWFRNKLPVMSLQFIVPEFTHVHLDYLRVEVIINGKRKWAYVFLRHLRLWTRDHIFVMRLSSFEVDQLIQEDRWNHVEVRADFAKEIGIHVIEQQSNINDIRFSDTYNDLQLQHITRQISKSSENVRNTKGKGIVVYKRRKGRQYTTVFLHYGVSYEWGDGESSCDDVNSKDICSDDNDSEMSDASERSCDDVNSEDLCSDNNDLHQQHMIEQTSENSENVRDIKEKEIVVYRGKANEKEDKKALEVISTTRDRGQGGTGSEQRRDRLHLCLCILISSLVLYRYSFLLPWLLGFLGLFAVFYV